MPACTARPLVISQGSMSLEMVHRVMSDGNSTCSHENGLKSIQWAYDIRPDNKLMDNSDPFAGHIVPYDDLPKSAVARVERDPYEAAREMERLAATGTLQKFKQSSRANIGPITASYICNSGAVAESAAFRFVP